MKKLKKGSRIDMVSYELNESHINPETGIIHLSPFFDLTNNEFKIYVNNDTLVKPSGQQSGYVGENKYRITSKIGGLQNDYTINLKRKLDRFDNIIAIDTNTNLCGSLKLSVSGSCLLFKLKDFGVDSYDWYFLPMQESFYCFEKPSESKKPENRNWKLLIERIAAMTISKPNKRFGILVDSDLGNINEYNKRRIPIYEDYFLPEKFELIFASDKTKDNILNQAIYKCHQIASKVFTNICSKTTHIKQ